MIFNCLPEGDTLADLARREHFNGFEVAFSKAGPDDEGTVDCSPDEAEFATVYARNDLGESIALHDVDLTNAGADSLAQACRATFAEIIAASRLTEIH